jgi:5-methylcytosine-specific restriction endonuclease McrA
MANKYTRIPNIKLFVKNSKYKNYSHLKKRIIKENLLPYICQICKLPDSWREKKLSLVLDHINGVKKDNRLSNLRFVCPNCDSQLPTFKSKNIKYQKSRTTSHGAFN